MQNQFETSAQHRKNLERGLTVKWSRTSCQTRPDNTWSVVCYSDDSQWLFDNSGGVPITLLGALPDGLETCEVLETENGAILALYAGGIESFSDRETWLDSLTNSDRPAAVRLLADN